MCELFSQDLVPPGWIAPVDVLTPPGTITYIDLAYEFEHNDTWRLIVAPSELIPTDGPWLIPETGPTTPP